ncbi:hypothetical protein IM697_44115 [Streptomyces ferrugineus]|uniref:Uncharacterized protein n=1 Tax=Streptomyces ferrugineus TaxID=1413221 RepID=A0A7M2SN02_9ACTN|nr:hypothetical protein [Streptomyces ferrugineus]QOV36853.1 hypothetical protein IM697_44115 [Streptomyces ferrugineus]
MTERIPTGPTGRLVIPAEAGSGKTVLVERLLVGDASWKSRTCGVAERRTAAWARADPAALRPPCKPIRLAAAPADLIRIIHALDPATTPPHNASPAPWLDLTSPQLNHERGSSMPRAEASSPTPTPR